ncbi:MAG: ferrous iron transport protein B [Campylobacterales bacterium]|nr:ferrous iron transport protein B [Campylobacterales bacterium]
MNNINVALVGQPNCGKSSIFNMLTNIKQHIANYPGVTIDKKSGVYSHKNLDINIIDLPGTYSFSSFSTEEKITRDYILHSDTNIIINTIDSSNIRRNLYLTMQLFDMQKPLVFAFNMLDVAKTNGYEFDFEKLSKICNAKIVKTIASKKQGLNDLKDAIHEVKDEKEKYISKALDYKNLQEYINKIKNLINIKSLDVSKHYLSVKLLENDKEIEKIIKDKSENAKEILSKIHEYQNEFSEIYKMSTHAYIVKIRYDKADEFVKACTLKYKNKEKTISDKIDSIVLNKFLALPILALIIFTLYQLSIVYGYELTKYTWPILAFIKNTLITFFPDENIASIPYITQFAHWMINSVNALLNYLPIFFILFFLIALLENVGYMPRMAFILDRIFVRFGLHGESTLPLVLGGIFAGGCAVPGVMATKGMNDKKAQMATMLTVPLMNCLAKIPFFTLILAAFFEEDLALMMFLISTITIFVALIVSKLLTLTVLRSHESTPFIMELPSYHMPTLRGLLIKVFDRIYLYLKKIVTIVAAVAVVLFVLIQFPGISKEKKIELDNKAFLMEKDFYSRVENNKYYIYVNEKKELKDLINYYSSYKKEKMNTKNKTTALEIDAYYKNKNSAFFIFAKPKKDKEARKINKALKKLLKIRKRLFREIKNEKIENSALGAMGKFFVPLTKYAGFDWKINVAFLSSFAARESSVSTIGAIYESHKDTQANSIKSSNAYSQLGAVAIIIFMALTPPCIATMIMIRVQSNSYKWMFFAIIYPMFLGLIFSIGIFQIGNYFQLSGVSAMVYFYILIILITIVLSLLPNNKKEIYV